MVVVMRQWRRRKRLLLQVRVRPPKGWGGEKKRGRGHCMLQCHGEDFAKKEVMPNKDGALCLMAGGGGKVELVGIEGMKKVREDWGWGWKGSFAMEVGGEGGHY